MSRIPLGIDTVERNHRQALSVREELRDECPEAEVPRAVRRDRARLRDRDELDTAAGELDDAVFGAPGVAVAPPYLEAELPVEFRRGIEISDREGRLMAYGTTRCLIVDTPFDLNAEYPEPETGPDEPEDPYLRPPPDDSYFDLETIVNGRPIDVQHRIIAGEVTPNTARLFGWRWEVESPGSVTGIAPTTAWFSAGAPFLYGGAIALLAESAMGSAVYSTLDPGEVFATLDMNIRFTRPVPIDSGELKAVGRVQHSGRRLRIASADLINAEGKRVAMATSSALVVPGGVMELMRGTPPEKLLGIR